MKTIVSEFKNDYSTYTFSYCLYAICERKSDLRKIYEAGYLPYSGSVDLKNYFYLARSLRVGLKNFNLNSENKRILKKFESKSFKRVLHKKLKSLSKKEIAEIKQLFYEYFKRCIGDSVMPKERVDLIFSHNYLNNFTLYYKEDKLAGVILLLDDGKDNRHYWFSAYAEEYDRSGFGVWLMLTEIASAKDFGYKNFYLGTGYGEKAKYKLNFDSVEFFDGKNWSGDLKILKKLLQKDGDDKKYDLIKENSFIF